MKPVPRLSYEQARLRHAGCYIELQYRKIDATYPDFEHAPVATAPAIFVWLDRKTAESADESLAAAIYWLLEWE